MRRRFVTPIVFILTMALVAGFLSAQEGYLTQKLMVENDLRQRIQDGLTKIIDPSQFVVDINVTLELSDAMEEQVTYGPSSTGQEDTENADLEALLQTPTESETPDRETMVGLPIPGFEFEVEPQGSDVETVEEKAPVTIESKPKESGEDILSRTASVKRPSIAKVQKMEISVILQEGLAPEMIENVRQIVLVASRYNRARGDKINLITASFKERKDEKTAEQILLKNIAEKLELIEKTRRDVDDSQTLDWKKELEEYKAQEAQRREEDREFFKSQLSTLEAAARERAFRKEKQEILRQDSLKLMVLNAEIQQLKAMIESNTVPDSTATAAESVISEREQERQALESTIEQRIAALESVKTELDQLQKEGGIPTYVIILLSLLGVLLLILLVALLFMAFRGSKQPAYPPPPYMYPPRRRKKKSRTVEKKPEPETTPVQPTPQPTQPVVPVEEDPSVLQSEIGDIRKSIVSMSVGQPETTSRIVKEWMQEEAPPPPAEPEETTTETPEEDTGKKKKKKK